MALDTFKNFAYGTLASGIAADATSATLSTGHGARFPSTAFNAVIWDTNYASPNSAYHSGAAEIVRVTARSTDTLTITRAQEGTTAVAFNTSGRTYAVGQTFTNKTLAEIAPLAGPTFTGTATVESLVITKGLTIAPAPMAALVIDIDEQNNTKSLSESSTLTLSDTLTAGDVFGCTITNTSASSIVVTLPEAWLENLGAIGTTITIAGYGVANLGFYYDGTRLNVSNDPLTIAQVKTQLDIQTSDVDGLDAALAAKVAAADAALSGVPTAPTAAPGTNTTQIATTAFVLANAPTGAALPSVTISALEIDWTDGTVFLKTLAANSAFTFANTVEGGEIEVYLTNPSTYTVGWPEVVWADGTAPVQTVFGDGTSKTDGYIFRRVGALIYGRRPAELTAMYLADNTAPVYLGSTINTAGTELTDTYNEELSPTITTTTGRAITLSGGAVTLSSPVVSTDAVVWTLSRTVYSGETCSANAYTAPGTGLKDLADNYAATYSGRQADLVNNSTQTLITYSFTESFEGSAAAANNGAVVGFDNAGWSVGSGSVSPNSTYSGAPTHGTYALYLANSYITRTTTGLTGLRAFYFTVLWDGRAAGDMMYFLSSGVRCGINVNAGGQARAFSGTGFGSYATAFTPGTLYHVWFDFTPGAGSGTANLYIATTATKPGSPDSTTSSGTYNDSTPDAFYIDGSTSNRYDSVILHTAAIGSNPVL